MTDKLIGPNIKDEEIIAGTRDIHNLCWRMVQGYRYLHGNNNPKKIVITMIGNIDGVPVEFKEDTPVGVKIVIVKEGKSAKAR